MPRGRKKGVRFPHLHVSIPGGLISKKDMIFSLRQTVLSVICECP